MKIIPTFIVMAALTLTASATKFKEQNHGVLSTNGKCSVTEIKISNRNQKIRDFNKDVDTLIPHARSL